MRRLQRCGRAAAVSLMTLCLAASAAADVARSGASAPAPGRAVEPVAPTAPASAVATAAVVQPTPALGAYQLGAGDKLRVIVFDEEKLTGEYFVSDGGYVALPLVGDIKAVGLTLEQFRGRAEEAFRHGYLQDPRIAVEILNYRPFYILGEVNKPGEYPYTSALTVLNAVATAQGFTYRANTKVVFVKHLGDAAEHKERVDSPTPLAPGDTIRVAERFF